MLDLWTETRELASSLDSAELPYALVGAIALAVHGVVRATADIDLLVLPEDLERIQDLARERGFTEQALPMRFADGTTVHRLVKLDGEHALTLDLLPVAPHLDQVWAGRERVETPEGTLSVVSRDGLIQMKTGAGRDQDLVDIRRLKELDA